MIIPDYIKQADIIKNQQSFIWKNDFDGGDFCPDDRKLEKKIGSISHKGVVLLSTGFTEWIAFAASQYFTDPILFKYIEAVRAGIIDWCYLGSLKNSGRFSEVLQWEDKAQGPIGVALLLLGGIVKDTKDGTFAFSEATSLSELALYIVQNKKSYREWRRFVIERFIDCYPLADDREGVPVPAEALDPDVLFPNRNSDLFLENSLKNLDYKSNPFLRSPEEMKKNGFIGVPYEL